MKRFLVIGIALVSLCGFARAQVNPSAQQIRQAESQLEQMTPEEIDAKIKSLGMTRAEAEARARSLGIDLNQYLRGYKGAPEDQQGGGQLQMPVVRADTLIGMEPIPVVGAVGPARDVTPEPITKGGLQYFGYDVFAAVPSAFEPTAAGPADPDYLIGPEDVLRVTMWGEYEMNEELVVDKEGRVLIRTVGPVVVSGLTLQQAINTLQRALAKSYAGLVAKPPTAFLDVTISRLRPKRIFIMGEVKNPGGYTVNSYATVFSSLFSVGGPTVKGSLRDIRVIRGNRIVARVDLYDYLTGADKIEDIRVQNNDIIQVPVRGRTIELDGKVKRPAIYELISGENLKKLIEYSGGVQSTAYLERVQISRVLPPSQRKKGEPERKVFDINFTELQGRNRDYELFDSDKITVFPIREEKRNYVTIVGAVRRPGTYQLELNTTVRDLVFRADSLLEEAYPSRVDIFRTRLDGRYEALSVDLSKALAGERDHNLALEPYDVVRIYSQLALLPNKTVSIAGHVLAPGVFPYAENLRLSDLIFAAGGLTDSLFKARTFLQRADVLRLNDDLLTYRTITVDLGKLLAGDAAQEILLAPQDQVFVYDVQIATIVDKYIEIRGEVKKPGRYQLASDMTIGDIIIQAGGYTERAWKVDATVARRIVTKTGTDSLVTLYEVPIPDFEKPEDVQESRLPEARAAALKLEHHDVVIVRTDPYYIAQRLVTVHGEVVHEGEYPLTVPGERLSSLIQRAGGLKKTAYIKGGRIFRDTTRVNSDFERALANPGGKYDVVMQEGDRVFFPLQPNEVRMSGEINNPGILGFVEGNSLWDYIDRAGGVKDSADYILVTEPTGNVIRVGTGWFASNPEIYDGSTIHVVKMIPPPPEEPSTVFNDVKDMLALIASVVTVLVLAKQL